MSSFGRVLLWTVALVAPGGFLLVPVLAATSLGRDRGRAPFAEQLESVAGRARAWVQRYWTKS